MPKEGASGGGRGESAPIKASTDAGRRGDYGGAAGGGGGGVAGTDPNTQAAAASPQPTPLEQSKMFQGEQAPFKEL